MLHEEQLANLSEDSRKLGSGEGRLSERHLKAEIERKKQALEDLAEEEDLTFDCICGAYGQIDDCTDRIACEKCNTWHHTKCVGVSPTAANRDDVHFICKTCQCRVEDRERRKPQPPIKMLYRAMPSSAAEPPQNQESGVGVHRVSPQFSLASGLSLPPRSSPEPGSLSAQFAVEFNTTQQNPNITVNPVGVLGNVNSAEKPARRKPGRKPGSIKQPKTNAVDSSATNTNAPKLKRTRKPRDPNAPPVPRRKRNTNSTSGARAPGTPEIHPFAAAPLRQQPQVLETAPNPNFHVPAPIASQPPPQNGKIEDILRQPIQSFFNTAPPLPPPQQQQQQQPIRRSGQNYDPIRSNYDPV